MNVYCENCGNRLGERVNFCGNCGMSISNNGTSNVAPSSTAIPVSATDITLSSEELMKKLDGVAGDMVVDRLSVEQKSLLIRETFSTKNAGWALILLKVNTLPDNPLYNEAETEALKQIVLENSWPETACSALSLSDTEVGIGIFTYSDEEILKRIAVKTQNPYAANWLLETYGDLDEDDVVKLQAIVYNSDDPELKAKNRA